MSRVIAWLLVAEVIYIIGVATFLQVPIPHPGDRDYLTVDTIISHALARFNRLDTTADGRLSLREFCAHMPAEDADHGDCLHHFTQIDADSDGLMTPREMANFYLTIVRKIEPDGDGWVTKQRWLAAMQEN